MTRRFPTDTRAVLVEVAPVGIFYQVVRNGFGTSGKRSTNNRKQIKLAAKAVVEGNLNYKLIEIEKGAEVVGSFVYHQAATNVSQFPADSKELKK